MCNHLFTIRHKDYNCHINLWRYKQDFRRFLCMGHRWNYLLLLTSFLAMCERSVSVYSAREGKKSLICIQQSSCPRCWQYFFLSFFFTINFSVSKLMAYYVLTCWLASFLMVFFLLIQLMQSEGRSYILQVLLSLCLPLRSLPFASLSSLNSLAINPSGDALLSQSGVSYLIISVDLWLLKVACLLSDTPCSFMSFRICGIFSQPNSVRSSRLSSDFFLTSWSCYIVAHTAHIILVLFSHCVSSLCLTHILVIW